eukprot:TRINITY_DN4319_c1_g3_i1.p1 TRINITY_DN4319_c1_g3~~TRINITY_DN4319_c1_g3_i1.p1  ORF type:complete len:227 (+),score=54.27 TRINITY_DN4319_c1_g3_i1:122-802(+)
MSIALDTLDKQDRETTPYPDEDPEDDDESIDDDPSTLFSHEIHSSISTKIHPYTLHFASPLIEQRFQHDIMLSPDNIAHMQRTIPFITAFNIIITIIHYIQIMLPPDTLSLSLAIRLSLLLLSILITVFIRKDPLMDSKDKSTTEGDKTHVGPIHPGLFSSNIDATLALIFVVFAAQSITIVIESPPLFYNSAFVLLHVAFLVIIFNILHWRFLSTVIIAHVMASL